jgi:hypothetical protein
VLRYAPHFNQLGQRVDHVLGRDASIDFPGTGTLACTRRRSTTTSTDCRTSCDRTRNPNTKHIPCVRLGALQQAWSPVPIARLLRSFCGTFSPSQLSHPLPRFEALTFPADD